MASFTLLNPYPSLSRSVGTFILFISSIGWISFWRLKFFKIILNYFFVINFFYWSFYLLSLVYNGGNFLSYSLLFSQVDGVLNHHLVALPISYSSIYILHRYFIYKNRITTTGFIFIILSFILLILSESRSNLLFYLFFVLLSYVSMYRVSFKSTFLIFISFFVFTFLYEYLFSPFDRIYQRFNINDLNYQNVTTQVRIAALQSFPVEFSKIF